MQGQEGKAIPVKGQNSAGSAEGDVRSHGFAMKGSPNPRKSFEAGMVLQDYLRPRPEDRTFIPPYGLVSGYGL